MPSPNLLALPHRAYESQHTHQKPAHKQWGTLIPCIVLTILATVTVLLRLYTRVYIIHAPGTDDAVILLSLLLSWAVCGLTAAMVAHGIGAYVWTSQLDLLPHNAKLVLAWNCVYVLLLYVTKASVLMQYLRIFAGNGTRGLTYLLLCCLLPPALYGIFGAIFLCRPVAKLWHVGLDGHCGSLRTYFLVTTSLNIVLDFCVLLLPLPKIWTLRLPRRQKIGLLLVFLLGFFVCAVSLARISLVHVAYIAKNYTDTSADAFTWSTVEANTGIICASLLALKPLLLILFPKLMDEGEGTVPKHCRTLPTVKDDSGSHSHSHSHNRSHGSEQSRCARYGERKGGDRPRRVDTVVSSRQTHRRADSGVLGTCVKDEKKQGQDDDEQTVEGGGYIAFLEGSRSGHVANSSVEKGVQDGNTNDDRRKPASSTCSQNVGWEVDLRAALNLPSSNKE